MPLSLAAGLSAALPYVASAQSNSQNARSSQWAYQVQNAQNLEFWKMQNDYNSPKAQMKRFQEAGLNPNLIYGQGNNQPAPNIKAAEIQTTPNRLPDTNIMSSYLENINSMYDTEMKQAQIDNLRAQNSVIQEDAALRRAQTYSTLTEGERKIFDLEYSRDMREVSADAAREKLRQTRVATDNSIAENVRRELLTSKSLTEAADRLKTSSAQRAEIRQRIENLQRDGTLKDIEINLRKNGINPNDPAYMRILGKFLNDLLEPNTDESILKTTWKWLIK